MTVPLFDIPLELRVLSMVMGGIKTTKELAEENGISFEEIEDLNRSKLLIPPTNRNGSRVEEGNEIEWQLSDTGKLFTETENIPIYPTPQNLDDYFTKNKKDKIERFVPEWLAKDIMHRVRVLTMFDNKDMYFYNGGLYRPNAERLVAWYTRKLLGEYASRNRESEVICHISSVTPFDREKFNSNPFIIGLKNGAFDIQGTLIHPHGPRNYLTNRIPVSYDSEADCPRIKRFVMEIVDKENVPMIREMIGYCLYRALPIQTAFMFLGDRNAGKSTLLNLITRFLGPENITNIELQNIRGFSVAELYGKLANIAADISDDAMKKTGTFKQLTGGDRVTGEKKHKNPFYFWNTAKLIFSCNKLPGTEDHGLAYFKRWRLIEFPNTFEGEVSDPDLLNHLTASEELSGLFNWAVGGLKRLLQQKEFTGTPPVDEIRSLYLQEASDIEKFLNDRTELGVGLDVKKEDLYTAFLSYCAEKRLKAITNTSFSLKFKMARPSVTPARLGPRGARYTAWLGIRLKENDD
jgi:putative DNA primase/helicase